MKSDMLECARDDIVFAYYALITLDDGDDISVNLIAYHCQQAIEKSLKAVLSVRGIDYRSMGHNIYKLYSSVRNQAVKSLSSEVSDFLENESDSLSLWESQTRYTCSQLTSLKKVQKAFCIAIRLFNDAVVYANKVVSVSISIPKKVIAYANKIEKKRLSNIKSLTLE